jgi:hypothetical protein
MRTITAIVFIAVILVLFNSFSASAEIVISHLNSDAAMLAVLKNVAFIAEGRIGDLGGAATFELDLGPDTGNPSSTEQYGWQSGVAEPFTLSYDHGTGVVTFTLGGKTLTYNPGMSFREIFVRTRAVNDLTSVQVCDLVLNGVNVGDISSTTGPDGLDILAISGIEIYNGFTLTGTAVLSWEGQAPTLSRLAFQIKVGNAPSVPVERSTWGNIKGLYK